MVIHIRDEFIKLGQAMKLADLVSDGVEANGEVDTRRGRKLYVGDTISYNGQDVQVEGESE